MHAKTQPKPQSTLDQLNLIATLVSKKTLRTNKNLKKTFFLNSSYIVFQRILSRSIFNTELVVHTITVKILLCQTVLNKSTL